MAPTGGGPNTVTPNTGTRGTAVSVVIQLDPALTPNLPPANAIVFSVTISGTLVTSSALSRPSQTIVVATFTIDAAAATGARDVNVRFGSATGVQRNISGAFRVGDQIFPCCGHQFYDVGKPEVAILGCASGIDFEIRHLMNTYQLTAEDGRIIAVSENDWREAVLNFSDAVMDFYDRSMPKEPADDDERKDFSAMMIEWQRLRDYHNREKQGEDGNRH